MTYNHRQEGEHLFDELFKLVGRGIKRSEDMDLLRTRVVPKNDPSIPKDTLYVFPRRTMVKEYNEKMISQLEGELEVLPSKNIMSTRKQFDPYIDEADGKVRGTPLQNILYLKKRAKVVLIHNLDVPDGLNNGAKGIILDFLRKDNKITHIVIEFENPEAGTQLRQQQSDAFKCLYPKGTPISALHFHYSVSKRQMQEGQKSLCIGFPIQLADAMTIQKVQGGTVLFLKP